MSVKRSILIVFVISICLSFLNHCGGGSKGPKVEYQLNLEKGETYTWEIKTEQKIVQKPMGQHMEITQKIRLAMDFTVNEADAGGYDITITFTGIGYYQDSPVGLVDYDSEDPPEVIPLMAQGFAGLLDEGFDIKIDKKGNVLDVKNVDLLFDRMVSKMELTVAQRAMVISQLRQQFGDKALLDSFQGAMSIFPENPVAVGDSWKRTFVMGGVMPMILHNRWKLTNRENGIAYMDVNSTIKPNSDGKPLKMGGVTLNYSLNGEQSGEMELDEKTGWTRKAIMEQNIKGTIKMASNSWPITIKSMIILSSQ